MPCARPGARESELREASHAQPLAVTDSADVAEIDKMAAFAQTGRKGRRNAVPDAGCKVVDGVLTFD